MATALHAAVSDLPTPVGRVLTEFVDEARTALGPTLRAIVLFGSAAEGRLRATSDVNVVVVLTAMDPARFDALRPAVERAHAAIRLEILWLDETEAPAAATAFPVKFGDILRRHRLLHGANPFEALTVSRAATIHRLRQVLLNQVLRLRSTYAVDGGREERLALRVADAAGPLRVSAAEILELTGHPGIPPRDALVRLAGSWSSPARAEVLAAISEARQTRHLDPERAGEIVLGVLDLARHLHAQALQLS